MLIKNKLKNENKSTDKLIMGVQQTINFPCFEWHLNCMKCLLNTAARMLPPLYETADVDYIKIVKKASF